MLFKWLLFLPSFVHFSEGSLTPEDFKTDVNFQSPSSTLRKVSLRNIRDRRMTHWESKSHLNFDDGNSHGDRRQVPYTSILQEPSSRQTPMDFKITEKSLSPNIKVTRNMLTGPLSRFNSCIVDVFPLRSMVSWLFTGAKYNSGFSRNGPLGVENLMIPLCERMAMQDQRIQEPVYVEEPGWIVIELNRNNLASDNSNSETEPFYVARGKRSLRKSTGESSKEEKSRNLEAGKLDLLISSDSSHKSQELSRSMRKKRDAFGASLRKLLLENGASNLVSSRFTEKSRQDAYVRPRNKHSDILDILNEPFFISRGKKNYMGIQRSESNDGYSTALLNFEMKRQFLDAWQPSKAMADCDSNSASNCSGSGSKINDPSSEPFRDRRGVVEELLKDTDPFYLSRGKRSPDTIQEYNQTTELLNKSASVNKNLSTDAQHG